MEFVNQFKIITKWSLMQSKEKWESHFTAAAPLPNITLKPFISRIDSNYSSCSSLSFNYRRINIEEEAKY